MSTEEFETEAELDTSLEAPASNTETEASPYADDFTSETEATGKLPTLVIDESQPEQPIVESAQPIEDAEASFAGPDIVDDPYEDDGSYDDDDLYEDDGSYDETEGYVADSADAVVDTYEADDANAAEAAGDDLEATTNIWSASATPESLLQTRTPTIRTELLSLPNLDDAEPQVEDVSATEGDVSFDETSSSEPEAFSDEPVAGGFGSTPDKDDSQPKNNVLKRVLMVLGIIFGVLLLIYLIGSIFFISHFMPNTRVNGDDVSWMSVDDLAAQVTRTGNEYKTHVTGDQVDLQISAADIELKYDGAAYGADAASQIEPWKWPARIFGSHDFHASTGITFNASLLEAIMNNAVNTINSTAQPPTNANMSFDDSKAEFVKVPDALGTEVDAATTMSTVSEGIRTLQDSIVLGDAELVQPKVRVDDEELGEVINQANKIVKTKFPLRVAGRDALTIDASLIRNWLLTNENCDLIIDTDKIAEWTQGDFSKTFDSVGTTRKYVRPDGKEITVSGGDYGWNIDGAELANLIGATLLNNLTTPVEVPMKSTAAEWNPGGADWGKRYIDVDMSEQYVRVYDENSQIVLESDCVTGVPYHATDEGVYTVYEHVTNMTLVGLDYNGDGQPDYQTPVSYWMPFNGGQGLHDAYWRGAFGGDIYQYDGSHGCVNLPSDVAASLFDWCDVGEVVVVHW